MRKNKLVMLGLTGLMAISLLAGCASKGNSSKGTTVSESTTVADTTEATTIEETEKVEGFSIFYAEALKDTEGEALQLDKMPEKIVCLSNAGLDILANLDIRPIAINSTASGDYPDWVSELPVIETGMSKLDTESVIALEPDLVIMGSHLKESYSGVLIDAGIPIYYTNEGHISYEETKDQALVLAKSFGGDEELEKLEAEFAEVEARAEEYKNSHEAQKAMLLFTPTYQSTSESYLGSMLKLMGFEIVSDSLVDPSLKAAPIDMEQLIGQEIDMVFAVYPGVPSSDMTQKSFEEEFTKNPEIWNQISAIEQGKIVYLSGTYATAKGANAINNLNDLIDMIEGLE